MILSFLKGYLNDSMPSSLRVLTWKDVKAINVKCKWQNTVYQMSQMKVVYVLHVYRTKDLERCTKLLNMVSLKGGGGWIQRGFTGAFHFLLFLFCSVWVFVSICCFCNQFLESILWFKGLGMFKHLQNYLLLSFSFSNPRRQGS